MQIRTMLPLAFGAMLALSSAASAHAFLKSATPAVGSTVTTAPTEVAIDFTEGVEPHFSRIEVQDAAGKQVDTGKLQADGPARLSVGLRKLAPGTYTVTWHAVAVDTHHTEGKFSFTVGQ